MKKPLIPIAREEVYPLPRHQTVLHLAFLKSFVEGIDVGESEVTVRYTLPVGAERADTATVGVLPIVHDGPPYSTKGKTFSKTFALAF